ncbi:reverse transcriptase [Senna tora]|uniref:Reverse transcriptase n=1 Tax=Senna tora TaxID=362788 RepID=A0A835CFW6_9FABA|nr:reverse transcriptase [Senna tora]
MAQLLAESMAHDMLLRLGHQPGRSRFSLLCHNSCYTRATHLSPATKIVTKSITSGTLLPAHISIKGGGTNDDDESQNPYSASPSIEQQQKLSQKPSLQEHFYQLTSLLREEAPTTTNQSQNPYSASPSIEVFTCLVDALEKISWLMSGGMLPSITTHHMQGLRSTHEYDPPACNKIWKLNEIGLEAFLKGLDSTSEHEADDEVVVLPVPPPTYKGKGKEKVNTLDFVDVNERRKVKEEVVDLWARSKLAAMEFLSSLQSNSSSSMTLEVNENSLCWAPPSKGKLKINCDGAYADLGKKGDAVDGFSRRVKACSPLMTEALAIEAAVECVENLGIDVAIIESDCQVLINAIYSEEKEVDWKCSAIISNIDLAKRRLLDVSFNFVGRCCNKAADWLAKAALGRMCPVDWVCAPPSSLARILASDKLGDRAGIR